MSSRRPERDWLIFGLTVALMLAADLISKSLAVNGVLRGEYLGGLLRLTLLHNPGAAFGLFAGARPIFIAVKIVALMAILYLLIRRRAELGSLGLVSLGLIFSGALGNLLDRLRGNGEVVDFIDLGIGVHRWYVFNVADAGICVGACLIALSLLLGGRSDASEEVDP